MQPLRHINTKNLREVLNKRAKRKNEHVCEKLVIAIGIKDGKVVCIKSNAPPIQNVSIIKDGKVRRRVGLHAEERVIKKCNGQLDQILIAQIVTSFNGKRNYVVPIDPCPKCQKIAAKYGITLTPYEDK